MFACRTASRTPTADNRPYRLSVADRQQTVSLVRPPARSAVIAPTRPRLSDASGGHPTTSPTSRYGTSSRSPIVVRPDLAPQVHSAPVLHGKQNLVKRAALLGERVLHRHGHRRVRRAPDDSLGLQMAQRVGERLGAHAKRAAQVAKAHGARVQLLKHEKRPLAREDLHHRADARHADGVMGVRRRNLGNLCHAGRRSARRGTNAISHIEKRPNCTQYLERFSF